MEKTAIFAVSLALLLLFGCTGQQQGQYEPQQNQPTQQQKEVSPSETLLNSLKANNGWKVKYQSNFTIVYGGTAGSASTTSTITQYSKSAYKFRIDTETSELKMRTYVISGQFQNCYVQNASWYCAPSAGPSIDPIVGELNFLVYNLQTQSSNYNITLKGSMQVAGVSSNCYSIGVTTGTLLYCVSSEGVPLYILRETVSRELGNVPVKAELRAIEYSLTVSDSEFELPATPPLEK